MTKLLNLKWRLLQMKIAVMSIPIFLLVTGLQAQMKIKGAEQMLGQIESKIAFEENQGQFDASVFYQAVDRQATYQFLESEVRTKINDAQGNQVHYFTMKFDDPSSTVRVKGKGPGRDNRRGEITYVTDQGIITRVRLNNSLFYHNLWDGISAHYFNGEEGMKYDFIVNPGADPTKVRFHLEGVKDVHITAEGELAFATPFGELKKGKPFTYQVIDGEKVEVSSGYQLEDGVISFTIGDYNPQQTLYIDPVALKYSTILGQGYARMYTRDIKYANNKIYLAGYIVDDGSSFGFPATTVLGDAGSTPLSTEEDKGFIMVMNANGSSVLSYVLFNNTNETNVFAIEVDENESVYVNVSSVDKLTGLDPEIAGVQPDVSICDGCGGDFSYDALIKFDSSFSKVEYFTYLQPHDYEDDHWEYYYKETDDDYYHGFYDLVLLGDGRLLFGQTYDGSSSDEPNAFIPNGPYYSNRDVDPSGFVSCIFSINTTVAGTAGLEGAAYFTDTYLGGFDVSPTTGNVFVIMTADDNVFDYDYITYEDPKRSYFEDDLGVDQLGIFVKLNPDLSEVEFGKLITFPFKVEADMSDIYDCYNGDIAVDAAENIYLTNTTYMEVEDEFGISRPDLNTDFPGDQVNYISRLWPEEGDDSYAGFSMNYLMKLPAHDYTKTEWLNVLPGYYYEYNGGELEVDNLGNIHLFYLTDQYYCADFTPPATPGALQANTYPSDDYWTLPVYARFGADGIMQYSTSIHDGFGSAPDYDYIKQTLTIDKITGTAYTAHTYYPSYGFLMPLTPSYHDFQTSSKVEVIVDETPSDEFKTLLAVFHDASVGENTIDTFPAGGDEFCPGSLLALGDDATPITGTGVAYESGDGSSETHNLPLVFYGGIPFDHPKPSQPKPSYQWQISTDDGSSWTNVKGGTKKDLKPQTFETADTVMYRRLVITGGVDTNISNIATAYVSGSFNLGISGPEGVVYFCPGLPTDLGITITGATGNISWQWYNGYDSLSTGIINPVNGAGSAASFTAKMDVSATPQTSGFYRLLVKDQTGCQIEYFVSVLPLTASIYDYPDAYFCPGLTEIEIGPKVVNPDFEYQITGPNSYLENIPNPVLPLASADTGVYNLQIKLMTDTAFCVGGATEVHVQYTDAHDAVLMPLQDVGLCQTGPAQQIGIAGTEPAGYTFSWTPALTSAEFWLDDTKAMNPSFRPGRTPYGGKPVDYVDFLFAAYREADRCEFSSQMELRDTATPPYRLYELPVYASACTAGNRKYNNYGAKDTEYFEWRVISTTYPGGVAALTSHPDFGLNAKGNTGIVNTKDIDLYYPGVSLTTFVVLELKNSYLPFDETSCYSLDTLTFELYNNFCGGGGGEFSCQEITDFSLEGAPEFVCGQQVRLGAQSYSWESATWNISKINGASVPAGYLPRGLYYDDNGTLVSLNSYNIGSHPTNVTAIINDSIWGYPDASSITYKFTGVYRDAQGAVGTCTDEILVYSPNYLPEFEIGPAIDVCAFPGPGTEISAPISLPYTYTSANYITAPDATNYQVSWRGVDGDTISVTNRFSAYPTFNPGSSKEYELRLYDPAKKCAITDRQKFNVTRLTLSAGGDLTDICPGNFLTLEGSGSLGLNVKWTPDSLNFYYPDLVTLNDTVLTPTILVPATAPTGLALVITGTDPVSSCVLADTAILISSPNGPATFSSATYETCANKTITIGPSGYIEKPDYVYEWVAETGADISWLDDPNVLYPKVSLPGDFSADATFRLTVNKGGDNPCGTPATNTFTIINLDPGVIITDDQFIIPSCGTPLESIEATYDSDFTYKWLPYAGLFTGSSGTTPYTGGNDEYVYVNPSATTTYTVLLTHDVTGCRFSDEIEVVPGGGIEVAAGDDVYYCGDSPIQIGETASGGTVQWTAVGYSENPAGQANDAPGALGTTMLSWLSSTASPVVNFNQSTYTPGAYKYRVTVDPSGCDIWDEVIVRVRPTVENLAGPNTTVCDSIPFQGGVENSLTGYSFEWSVLSPAGAENVFSNSKIARPMITLTQKSNLEVIYTDLTSGCEYTDIVAYDIAPSFDFPDITTDTFCEPQVGFDLISLITDYDSLFVPTWYRNSYPSVAISGANAVNVNTTTSFFITAENKFGCEEIAEVVVPIEQPETPVVFETLPIPPGDSTIDIGDFIPATASVPGGTFNWFVDSLPSVPNLVANTNVTKGTFYIYETGPAGCIGDFSTTTTVYDNSRLSASFVGDSVSPFSGITLSLSSVNFDFIDEKTDLYFSMHLPSGLSVLEEATNNNCGGTLSASIGDTVITLSGAQLAQNSSCQIEVVVGGAGGTFKLDYTLLDSVSGWLPDLSADSIFLDPNYDTDGDGVTDSVELSQMTDIFDPCDPVQEADYTDYNSTNVIWGAADCDGDSISNAVEDSLKLNPYLEDTDGDGASDLSELNAMPPTDPTDPCDPVQNDGYTAYDSTNVVWQMADCDGDSLANGVEDSLRISPYSMDTDGDGVNDIDELDGDADDDPLDPCMPPQDTGYVAFDSTNVVWQAADCDGDSINNIQEVIFGMDPYVFSPDTDGDGILNSIETANGSDPFDPCDPVQPIGYTDYVSGNSTWATADCDGDGTDNTTELGDSTDPYDPCVPAQMEGYTGYVDTNEVWQAGDCDMDNILNGVEDSIGADPYATDPNFVMQGNDSTIAAGSTTFSEANLTSFGERNLNSVKRHRFQVKNFIPGGNGPMTTGPEITLTGGDGMFSVEFEQDCEILPSTEAALIIKYQPTAEGCHTATVSIPHSDTEKPNPFTFQIQGRTKGSTCQ